MNRYPSTNDEPENTWQLKLRLLVSRVSEQSFQDAVRRVILNVALFIVMPVLVISGMIMAVETVVPWQQTTTMSTIAIVLITFIVVATLQGGCWFVERDPVPPKTIIVSYILAAASVAAVILIGRIGENPADSPTTSVSTAMMIALLYGPIVAVIIDCRKGR